MIAINASLTIIAGYFYKFLVGVNLFGTKKPLINAVFQEEKDASH